MKRSFFDDSTRLPPWRNWEKQLIKKLPACRWFGSKSRKILNVSLIDLILLGQTAATVVRVSFTSGPSELYVLPVFENSEGEIADATFEPAFALELFSALTDQRRTDSNKLHAELSRPFRKIRFPSPGSPVLAPYVLKGEQSNTSIAYGKKYVLKLYRRMTQGVNPDIEVPAYLTDRTSFKNTPSLVGTLTYRDTARREFPLASLQLFVPNRGDAWKYLMNELTPLREEEGNEFHTRKFQKFAAKLGRRTMQLHLALFQRRPPVASSFLPEKFTPTYQKRLHRSLKAHANQVLSQLKKRIPLLPSDLRPKARYLLSHRERLLSGFDTLKHAPVDAVRLRIHGDYHLGQVLYDGSDFHIIDFEGEPARSLRERQAKHSPLRDVAGMIRSFHYAAHMGLRDRDFQEIWYNRVKNAFLEGYFSAAPRGRQSFLPRSEETIRRLLDIYLLEKALYELSYEMNNRPDWVRVPLSGILQILDGLRGETL